MNMSDYNTLVSSKIDVVEDWDKLPSCPLVSVAMTTYNHESFIRMALDSILMQKVEFDYEVLIAEDCSTDKTREIVVDYQRRYPDKFRLRLARENLLSQGLKGGITNRAACRGKYIAMCEGDDYWTDPLKLQKQVDFMEAHPGCSLCGHGVKKIDSRGTCTSCYQNPVPEVSTIRDIIQQNYLITPSVMFRNCDIDSLFHMLVKAPQGDWLLYVFLARQGDIGFINEEMAVYRVHENGVWSSLKPSQRQKNELIALKTFKEEYGRDFPKEINDGMLRVLRNLKICYRNEGARSLAWIAAFQIYYHRIWWRLVRMKMRMQDKRK